MRTILASLMGLSLVASPMLASAQTPEQPAAAQTQKTAKQTPKRTGKRTSKLGVKNAKKSEGRHLVKHQKKVAAPKK